MGRVSTSCRWFTTDIDLTGDGTTDVKVGLNVQLRGGVGLGLKVQAMATFPKDVSYTVFGCLDREINARGPAPASAAYLSFGFNPPPKEPTPLCSS